MAGGAGMSVHDPQTEDWHVDRRVPLALIWTISAQTVAIIVAGTLMFAEVKSQARDIARVEAQLDRDIARLDRQTQTLGQAANQQAIQLGRIEENLAAMRGDIRRLVSIWEGATP